MERRETAARGVLAATGNALTMNEAFFYADAVLAAVAQHPDPVREALIRLRAMAELARSVLDAERERTGVDEWDESDERCYLYNVAHAVIEGEPYPYPGDLVEARKALADPPLGREPQRQDSLDDQLRTVRELANRAGCYDAADWIGDLAGLRRVEQVGEDERETERLTHGRHCLCSACAAEDWTNPQLAPCGMHGSACPRRYDPRGRPGQMVPAKPSLEPHNERETK